MPAAEPAAMPMWTGPEPRGLPGFPRRRACARGPTQRPATSCCPPRLPLQPSASARMTALKHGTQTYTQGRDRVGIAALFAHPRHGAICILYRPPVPVRKSQHPCIICSLPIQLRVLRVPVAAEAVATYRSLMVWYACVLKQGLRTARGLLGSCSITAIQVHASALILDATFAASGICSSV